MKTLIESRPNAALAGLLLVFGTTLSATAADLHVPADYRTIQAAVDAVQSNDTVRIAPGVYAEQIFIFRKNLTLVGAPGTVIRAKTGMTASLAPYVPLATGVPLLVAGWSHVGVSGLEFEGEHLATATTISWDSGLSARAERWSNAASRVSEGPTV